MHFCLQEELEKQVRSLAEPHSDARDKTTMRRSNSDDIRTGAYSGVSGIAKGKLPSDTMSRQATSSKFVYESSHDRSCWFVDTK